LLGLRSTVSAMFPSAKSPLSGRFEVVDVLKPSLQVQLQNIVPDFDSPLEAV
jgi:hypothetical protein